MPGCAGFVCRSNAVIFAHIAEHDLTPDDVEAVLLHPVAEDISRSSGRPMVYGFTPDGRYIVMVYEEVDYHTLYPVTAYVIGI
jgi:hypothetical protein